MVKMNQPKLLPVILCFITRDPMFYYSGPDDSSLDRSLGEHLRLFPYVILISPRRSRSGIVLAGAAAVFVVFARLCSHPSEIFKSIKPNENSFSCGAALTALRTRLLWSLSWCHLAEDEPERVFHIGHRRAPWNHRLQHPPDESFQLIGDWRLLPFVWPLNSLSWWGGNGYRHHLWQRDEWSTNPATLQKHVSPIWSLISLLILLSSNGIFPHAIM